MNEWMLGWLAPAGPPPDTTQVHAALAALERLVAEDVAAARTPAEAAERGAAGRDAGADPRRWSTGWSARSPTRRPGRRRATPRPTTPRRCRRSPRPQVQSRGPAARRGDGGDGRAPAAAAPAGDRRRAWRRRWCSPGSTSGCFRPLFGRLAAATAAAEALAAGGAGAGAGRPRRARAAAGAAAAGGGAGGARPGAARTRRWPSAPRRSAAPTPGWRGSTPSGGASSPTSATSSGRR